MSCSMAAEDDPSIQVCDVRGCGVETAARAAAAAQPVESRLRRSHRAGRPRVEERAIAGRGRHRSRLHRHRRAARPADGRWGLGPRASQRAVVDLIVPLLGLADGTRLSVGSHRRSIIRDSLRRTRDAWAAWISGSTGGALPTATRMLKERRFPSWRSARGAGRESARTAGRATRGAHRHRVLRRRSFPAPRRAS